MSRIKAGREGQFCVTGRFVRNISDRTDEPAIGSAQKTLQYLIIQLNTKKNHIFNIIIFLWSTYARDIVALTGY
ncbi:hypothetical protein VEE40_40420 [Escherichia coli]|nr:hypothetical protein VEE40_40420 [Escherichia coli]